MIQYKPSGGCSHKGVKLGQKVKYKAKDYIIIGFDLDGEGDDTIAINVDHHRFAIRRYNNRYSDLYILEGFGECPCLWVSKKDLVIIGEPILNESDLSQKI